MAEQPHQLVPQSARAQGLTSQDPSDVQGRVASYLFSSSAKMLVLIPGLMLLAGAGLVWMGQSGLRSTIETSLRQRVDEQTVGVASATTATLDQALPLLDAIRDLVLTHRDQDPAAFAGAVRELIIHRPGLENVAFSTPGGTRKLLFVDEAKGGAIRLLQSWIESDRTSTQRISDIAADGTLVAAETKRDTGYYPSKRPYFAPAVAASAPVWTAPYEFYSTKQTGITCALAMRDPLDGALLGVATVDFDLSTLSDLMRHLAANGPQGEVVFLMAQDGTLMATSLDPADGPGHDLQQSLITTVTRVLPSDTRYQYRDLADQGVPLLVGLRGIQLPGAPLWFAGTYAPRSLLSQEVTAQLRRTLWVGVIGLAGAVGLSVLLANYLARQRRIALAARAAVVTAQERLERMGSYTLIRELGVGGMGAVWLAEHQLLARPAALKLIKFDLFAHTPAERAIAQGRFEREAKATASLRSRNTETLYDYGLSADGSFYYAMELLDGLDLERLVIDFGAQPVGRVVQILIQICGSLAEAHDYGMVHRDIKPANIYLCRLGTEVDVVKVLDFGLVAERTLGKTQLTGVGVVQGTPAFMAPEQAMAEPLDGRADLYAVGCIAYWLLSGKLLFDKEEPMALLLEQVSTAPRPLAEVAAQAIPFELNDLVMQLLAKAPAARPASARDVIHLLRAVRLTPEQAWSTERAETWWILHHPVQAERVSASAMDRHAAATVVPSV